MSGRYAKLGGHATQKYAKATAWQSLLKRIFSIQSMSKILLLKRNNLKSRLALNVALQWLSAKLERVNMQGMSSMDARPIQSAEA
ncbi:MAG: hypothetical protein ACI9SP_003137 [Arenicella sp.]